MAPVTLKYFNFGPLGARGGVTRFFMLANNIDFKEELIDFGTDWPTEKKRLLDSGENPCGTVPLVYTPESEVLSQHIATCRLLAKRNGISSGDDYQDYIQDLVGDEYQSFRNKWVSQLSSTAEQKEAYKNDEMPGELTKFNSLYKKFATSAPYLSVNDSKKPLWGDAAIFGLLYDHVQTGFITAAVLESEYPALSALYEAFGAIPAVAKWIDEKQKK